VNSYNIKYDNNKNLNTFIKNNKNLLTSKSILIQIFSGILDKRLLLEICNTILNILPNANIIGATTDGEVIENEVTTKSIIISFSTFEKTSIKTVSIEPDDITQSYNIGKEVASKLTVENTKAMILFADGLHINAEELLNGVSKVSPNVIIAGGLAGDNAIFKDTYIIHQNKILNKGVVGISLNSDDLIVNNSYSFAWQTIGKTFVVNKSIKNTIYEIDGMSPVALYEKYLGKAVSKLLPGIGIEFPLIIQDEDMQLARAVLSKNDDGSLVFAGNIKEGTIVRFGVGDASTLIKDSIELSKDLAKKPSQSIFIYTCMARRHFLNQNSSDDIKYFSKIANVSGFFTYGEIYTKDSKAKILNETLTTLSLSEENTINDIEFDEIPESSSFATLQALSHLVNVSSSELDKLNENLEDRIEVEICKNEENEKKLFTSMKMSSLGDMIANIAHQWRQPLSVISTIASGLQLQKDFGKINDDDIQTNMDKIIKQSNYLSEIINTFRDFIKEDYILSDIELTDDINKTLKIIDAVFKDNNIKLINNIDYMKKVRLNLISGELSQVIINIFNNAKDALIINDIEEKKIYLDVIIDNEYCIITIEDNAGGIPEDILPKIFEPYFTTKHKNNGTGIGLYMSYDIITKHFAGDLYAKNTHNGAKFYIKLPINK